MTENYDLNCYCEKVKTLFKTFSESPAELVKQDLEELWLMVLASPDFTENGVERVSFYRLIQRLKTLVEGLEEIAAIQPCCRDEVVLNGKPSRQVSNV
jgi:hypothetical protein